MSTYSTYFPREITVKGKRYRWLTGRYIGNLEAAKARALEMRRECVGCVVRRVHCSINVYRQTAIPPLRLRPMNRQLPRTVTKIG